MPSNNANLGCGSLTIQYLVFLFNLIFFAGGLVLIIVGGIAQGFFKEYIQFFDNEFKTPAMGLIILGAIILVVSFFGCCGARKQNVCMLNTFSFFLGLLLVMEIIAAITIAAYKSDIENEVARNMNTTMFKYGPNDTLATNAWDDLQETYKCCGTYNYTNWKDTEFSKGYRVPDSCCKEIREGCGNGTLTSQEKPEDIYTSGCFDSLKASAKHNLGIIIGAAVAIAIVQVVGVWMSCCLVRAVKENYEVL
ncbi:UNVERIFIED_CONTAM: hypothetical protein RMT77_006177 [Armadillidium vulgare]|nr:CD63 antigen [Armadillidium vulgare]